MSWLTRLRRYVRDAVRGGHLGREIDAELQFHVDALVDELVERGASPDEARRIARRRFGRLDIVRDEARYAKGVGLVDDLRQDVRYGLRRLRRQPGFAVAVVALFGLGIGVNAVAFSLVDALLLKPLPFRDADRLVDILDVLRRGTAEETRTIGMSRARLEDWRAQRQIFDAVEAHSGPRPMPLGGGQGAVLVAEVAPGLFPMLGLSPALGRRFSASEAGSRDVVIISDRLWKRVFGADARVLGRRLRLKDAAPLVVGVMPPGTRFPLGSQATDAWLPLDSARGGHVVAKLREGLAAQSAQPDLDRAAAAIQRVHPAREPWDAEIHTIDPRRSAAGFGPRPVVLMVFGAVILVLLTACANVASLLLARTAGREREFGVRRALGAGRLRLARQVLVESGILALGGGAVAVLLAAWLVRLTPAMLPPDLVWFPVHEMALDWRVLVFALAATTVVGLFSGMLPALRGSRGNAAAVQATAPMASRTRFQRRTSSAFVAVQVALAFVLLVGAALMTGSFARMVRLSPGYDARDLLAVFVRLPESATAMPGGRPAFTERLLDSVRSIPGVKAATSGVPPASGGGGNLVPEGRERDPRSGDGVRILQAGNDYFRVLGLPIVAGRAFSPQDGPGTSPVGIVDEATARRLWPGQGPLGKRVRYSPYVAWITIVGVARPVKTPDAASAQDIAQLYLPESQHFQGLIVLARTDGHSAGVLAGIRARLSALEPKATIGFSRTIEEMYDEAFVNPRFTTALMSVFAALALLTAAVGVYAMVWHAVAQRTSEIGVRVALGASPFDIRRLVFVDGLRPVALGMLAGAIAAWWLTQLIAAQLYHVSPHDPLALAAVVAVLLVIAALAIRGPARRAMRVDPIVALRCE